MSGELDPKLVAARLREAAARFRFLDAAGARAAMEGAARETTHAETREAFVAAVPRRLEVLRALDRRRRAVRNAMLAAEGD